MIGNDYHHLQINRLLLPTFHSPHTLQMQGTLGTLPVQLSSIPLSTMKHLCFEDGETVAQKVEVHTVTQKQYSHYSNFLLQKTGQENFRWQLLNSQII